MNKNEEPIKTWGGPGGFNTTEREDNNIKRIILGVVIISPILLILIMGG